MDEHYLGEHYQDGGEVDPPEKTVKAYKLFRTNSKKPGQLFPLFVDANTPVPIGKWVAAKAGDPGKDPTKVKSKLGDLAYRPGWHAGDLPVATHIGGKSSPDLKAPDYRPDNHVWAEIEMPDDIDWQSVANSRMERTKAGAPKPATAHITDQVPFGGHYRYKTNPNMTGNWMIGGSMKVNRVLGDDEVKAINDSNGAADLPRLARADGGEVEDGITAYHGSPHDFEQFDTSKIGTGEGAQAYGHGLYMAKAEPVAQTYRGDPEARYRYYSGHMDPKEEAAFHLATQPDARDMDVMMGLAKKYGENIDFDEAQRLAKNAMKVRGHMYEVHINAHPNHFLDWDRPITEQPHIMNAIDQHIGDSNSVLEHLFGHSDATGRDLHDKLGGEHKPKAVAEKLSSMGIKGIKYLDAGLRGDKAEPTHNYVVFDHNDVHIKRKYEQGGAVDGYEGGGSVHDKFLPHNHPQRQQNLGEFLKESAVKHPDGRPKVVYHNTNRSFNEFRTAKSEMGAHFGTPAQANDILESTLDRHDHQGYPVYLNLKNPLRLRDTGTFDTYRIHRQLKEMGLAEGLPKNPHQLEMQEHLQSLGYDGVVYLNRREGISRAKGKDPERYNDYSDQMFKHHFPDAEDSYIAFDPTQIKSAIGNNGYYDPNSPRIDEHDGGRIERNTGGPVNVSKAEDTAGNFKKEHEKIHGIPVAVEVKEGHDRVKYEPDGDIKFKAKQYADYGAILGTKDADGMNTDVMVGPHKDSDKAYIIDQRKHSTGKFDEHKVMLGFNKRKKAIKAYTKSYADRHGKERVQDVVKTDIAGLKKWLKHGDLKKPAAKGALINRALEVVSRKT